MSSPKPRVNMRNLGVKRIMQEAAELADPDTDDFVAAPLESDIFEWHCTVRGVPGTDYEGGLYHLRIVLPSNYPMSAPDIILLTPNGRFELNKKICIDGLTSFHAGSWQPAWGVRTAITGLRSFWTQDGEALSAIGALDYSRDERRRLAKLSREWVCPTCQTSNGTLLPDPIRGRDVVEGNVLGSTSGNVLGTRADSEVENKDVDATEPEKVDGTEPSRDVVPESSTADPGPQTSVPPDADTSSSIPPTPTVPERPRSEPTAPPPQPGARPIPPSQPEPTAALPEVTAPSIPTPPTAGPTAAPLTPTRTTPAAPLAPAPAAAAAVGLTPTRTIPVQHHVPARFLAREQPRSRRTPIWLDALIVSLAILLFAMVARR